VSQEERNLGPVELLAAVRRRYYVVLAAVAACVFAGLLLARSKPEKYRATVRILIEPRRPRFPSTEGEAGTAAMFFFYRNELQTQILLMESRPVAERAVAKLGPEKLPEVTLAPDPASVLVGLCDAEPVGETRFVELVCKTTDPQRAADIANAVAEAYIEETLLERKRLLNETMAAYTRRVPERLKQLEEAEAELLKFKEEHNIVSSDRPDQALRRQEVDLIGQLSTALGERVTSEARLMAHSADGKIGRPHADLAQAVVSEDGWVRHLLDARLAQRSVITELGKSFSEGHPKLDSAKTSLAEIERELAEASKSCYERMQLAYDAAVWKEKEIKRLLADHRVQIVRLGKQLSRYENLQQRRDSLRAVLEPVARSRAELDFIANLNLPNASVTGRASPPAGPSEPSIPNHVLVGLVLGLVLGGALALLLELADESVRTPGDLVRAAPVKMLGMVSLIRRDVARGERARALATAERSDSTVAEQFRSLRTAILSVGSWDKDGPGRVVLVTSPGLADGKTTVSFNAAEAFAQLGKPVVVVEADLRRPKGHNLMGLPRSPGIVEVLEGECELAQAVRKSPVPNLSVLPAGRRTPRPAELVGSDGFRKLLEELRQSYSVVWVDSPPVMPVADARVLVTEADLVLVVVRSTSTRRKALARTYELLGGGNGAPIAAVLNGLGPSVEKAYGYYGRSYERHYRARPPSPGREARGS
jgi:capsular exopolysaccharide synthesis family protein